MGVVGGDVQVAGPVIFTRSPVPLNRTIMKNAAVRSVPWVVAESAKLKVPDRPFGGPSDDSDRDVGAHAARLVERGGEQRQAGGPPASPE